MREREKTRDTQRVEERENERTNKEDKYVNSKEVIYREQKRRDQMKEILNRSSLGSEGRDRLRDNTKEKETKERERYKERKYLRNTKRDCT